MSERNPFRAGLGVLASLVLALVVVLALIALVLVLMGKDPGQALTEFLEGALGSDSSRADVVMSALPLLLCASGLLLTFTAGLWNIGVEGQVTMGAVFATIIARQVTANDTSPLIVPAELVLAMLGGALWAGLAAILKIRGNINEIFGGVALNFISQNILLSLVNGPWKGQRILSPQTDPFLKPALLAQIPGTRISAIAIGIALLCFLAVYFLLRNTRWGLQLRAMGRSERSAFLLGVRTNRNVLLSMIACGALAGLAGAFQALVTRERLIPGISGGIGFLAVLVVLLVNVRATWVPLVALFFALVPVGSLTLNISMQIEDALGKVFQTALVLAVILANGIRARLRRPAESN